MTVVDICIEESGEYGVGVGTDRRETGGCVEEGMEHWKGGVVKGGVECHS